MKNCFHGTSFRIHIHSETTQISQHLFLFYNLLIKYYYWIVLLKKKKNDRDKFLHKFAVKF